MIMVKVVTSCEYYNEINQNSRDLVKNNHWQWTGKGEAMIVSDMRQSKLRLEHKLSIIGLHFRPVCATAYSNLL